MKIILFGYSGKLGNAIFKKLKTKNLNQLKEGMYLVDLTKSLIQKYKNVTNIKVNTRTRIGQPRIGGLIRVNLIMIKLLLFITFAN
jgi:dihydrodipicolinate reductase